MITAQQSSHDCEQSSIICHLYSILSLLKFIKFINKLNKHRTVWQLLDEANANMKTECRNDPPTVCQQILRQRM